MHCGKPLKSEEEEFCADCAGRESWYRAGRSVWLHQEPVSGALYRFKYHNRRCYAEIFAEKMDTKYAKQLETWEIEEIIPIPLHRVRRRKRGFNQSELLAEQLAQKTGIPINRNVLYRIRNTKPLKEMDGKERRRNLQGAFGVSSDWNPCRNVLLIDDIYTTGSTIERAAKLLRKAGVQNVYFLTVSIGQGR